MVIGNLIKKYKATSTRDFPILYTEGKMSVIDYVKGAYYYCRHQKLTRTALVLRNSDITEDLKAQIACLFTGKHVQEIEMSQTWRVLLITQSETTGKAWLRECDNWTNK